MSTNTDKQIERLTGSMRLPALPRSLHLGLVDLLNKELATLPPMTGHHIKENCIAAVSLVMRSSKTDEIYEAEIAREALRLESDREAEQFMQLQDAKNRMEKYVEYFEAAMLKRSLPQRVIDQSYAQFCAHVAGDPAALVLMAWATNLYNKRTELR